MIVKQFGVVCNKCKSILYENGECICGELGAIFSKNNIFVYTDTEEFTLFMLYIDKNTNNVVKAISLEQLLLGSYFLPLDDDVLNKVKP